MRRVYSVIFLVSSSALIFEVSLTRLFSIYLSYHFAFMVISIAMLGIGSASIILAFFSSGKLSENSITRSENRLALYALYAVKYEHSVLSAHPTLKCEIHEK